MIGIIRRRHMCGGRLPAGYIQLEYIQGTGSQYIDTGFLVNKNDNYALEVDAAFDSQTQAYQGCNGYMQFYVSSVYGISANSAKAVGNRDIVKIAYANQTAVLIVNGVQIESKSWASYSGANVKLGVFRLGEINNGWFSGTIVIGKLYGYKVWKDGILVSDCIPCQRKSDGAIGMYDVLQSVFRFDPNSGVFLTPDTTMYAVTTGYMPQAGLVTVNGLDLPTNSGNTTTTYTVPSGAIIILRAKDETYTSSSPITITVDGTVVATATNGQSVSYSYAVTKNCTVHASQSAAGVRSWITT